MTSIALPSTPTLDLRELRDGDPVDHVVLVRERELRRTRTGAHYLRLGLADRTGSVAAVVWDDVDEAASTAVADEPVRVIGTFSQHPRYGPQITVETLLAPLEIDWDRLLDGPAVSVAELERRLDAHIAGIADPYLAALLDRLLGAESETGRAFRRAFAAQYNHHAYRSGLLEHSLQVADACADAARTFPGIDGDLAVAGALVHDIGKLDAYSGDACGVRLNDGCKLIGEIPDGYYTVRRAIEDIAGFPPQRAEALLHIILSHHGCLEHGSPVLPSTREALVVHAMDKLSGDLGSFERLERETAEDERWSRFDRGLGRPVLLDRATPHTSVTHVGGRDGIGAGRDECPPSLDFGSPGGCGTPGRSPSWLSRTRLRSDLHHWLARSSGIGTVDPAELRGRRQVRHVRSTRNDACYPRNASRRLARDDLVYGISAVLPIMR